MAGLNDSSFSASPRKDAAWAQTPLPPLPQKGEHGWLLPALLQTDCKLYGRWEYLADCWPGSILPSAPIPNLAFLDTPDPATWKMLTASLDAIPAGGARWMSWNSPEYWRFFLEWTLFGLGHPGQPQTPPEPLGCAGASERLESALDLALWQRNPYDYLGDLLAQNAYGKRQGFYPTPHPVAELMTHLTMGDSSLDTRTQTVCDPCVGTGRLLLHASNHSLRLYGMDIDPLLCLATLVNGYLFAPWLVRPLPLLDQVQYQPQHSEDLSNAMAKQAPPHHSEYLRDTQHDGAQQWRFEPIKKRQRQGDDENEASQGVLF